MDAKREVQYKYQSKSSIAFSYYHNPANFEAQEIKFDSYPKKCILSHYIEKHGSSKYVYNCKFIVEFDGIHSFDKNNNFQLIVHFGESKYGHVFILHQNDEKTFSSELIMYEPAVYNTSEYFVHVEISFLNNSDIIIQSLKDMLLNEVYSDIKLVVGGRVFNVHKNILASRNEVLAKMIDDMLKVHTDNITLLTWDPTAVDELLKYVYTGMCDVTKVPHKLLILSHFLQIEELQQLCKNYLKSHLHQDNLIETLEMTKQSQYRLDDLKKAAIEYIRKNELTLAEDMVFIEYLSNSIDINNVLFVLQFSSKYDIKTLLKAALRYVCFDMKEVLKNAELKNFLRRNFSKLKHAIECI